jgi:hypothetical protein
MVELVTMFPDSLFSTLFSHCQTNHNVFRICYFHPCSCTIYDKYASCYCQTDHNVHGFVVFNLVQAQSETNMIAVYCQTNHNVSGFVVFNSVQAQSETNMTAVTVKPITMFPDRFITTQPSKSYYISRGPVNHISPTKHVVKVLHKPIPWLALFAKGTKSSIFVNQIV